MKKEIVHNGGKHQFEITEGEETAYVAYEEIPDGMDFIATFVPNKMQGKGIGSALAEYALTYAKNRHEKIEATCPFIREYIKKHPEFAEK